MSPPGARLLPDEVTRRTVRGGVALAARHAIARGLDLLGAGVVASLAGPADLGVFAILALVVLVGSRLTDPGLAASLVQDPDEPHERDVAAVFTMEIAIAFVVAAALLVLAPALSISPDLAADGRTLAGAAALAVLLAPFQTIPILLLERRLAFERIAVVEVLQAAIANGVLVACLTSGLGLRSFAAAVAVRAVSGAVLAAAASPWRPALRAHPGALARRLRFGLPYQGSALVALAADALAPVVLGLWASREAVGQATWAAAVAGFPSLAVMLLGRLFLASFAKLQDRPDDLARLVERVVLVANALAAPLAVVTLVLAEPATRLLFGPAWLPAVALVPWFAVVNAFAPTAAPLVSLLNALGDTRSPFRLALVWLAGTWTLGALLVVADGARGAAMATAVLQLVNLPLVPLARVHVPLRLLPSLAPPWTCAVLAGAAVALGRSVLPADSFGALVVLAGGGLAVHAVGLALWFGFSQARRTC